MTKETTTAMLPLMGHLVLGYPNLKESIRTAETYIEAGVEILELQIPFSHPTADGPVITQACRVAIEEQHVRVEDAIEAIRSIRSKYPAQEIIVMSYINRIFAFGVEKFSKAMAELGVYDLIVPDLPVDSPVAKGLHNGTTRLVPVIAANITDHRLDLLLDKDFKFFYLMSDFKITGSGFSLHPRLQGVIEAIREELEDARIGIGFGISTPEQANVVLEYADYAIIGSALIQAREEDRLEAYLETFDGA